VRSTRLILVLKLLLGVLTALFMLFTAIGLYLYRLSLTLPELGVEPAELEAPRTSIIYASDGSVLAEWHGEQDRKIVSLEELPQGLRDAVVAIEDERFYEHHGVDTRAILRALKVNASSRAYAQGGSTITQQLVKVLFVGGERTFTRKVREALLAYQIEYKTDKDKVLEAYLNVVYLGNGRYGVESASRAYFGKPASDLSLSESALLAGVIRAPSAYSPLDHFQDALRRRDVVLRKMREQGYITSSEERDARLARLAPPKPRREPARAPYLVEYVKQDLIDRLGTGKVFGGGLRVHTTLDPILQSAAEQAAKKHLGGPKDPDVSLVSIEYRTGRIRALVGGRDFAENQFNLATQGRRQPGSAFKPFVLVTALQEGIRPEDVFPATPYSARVKDGVWRVDNYENSKTTPKMTLRAATDWSVNAVYARLIMKVGPADVVKTAHAMGITTPMDPDPAIALGGLKTGVSPLEMASAYGTIAAAGLHVPPVAVERVEDDKGHVIYTPSSEARRAISENVAVKTALMLHDVVEHGTGTAAKMKVWAAGKTGTTQSYRDAWFVGYAGDLSTSVWVGFREAQVDMTHVRGIKVTGGSFPAKIWKTYMERALAHENSPVTPKDTVQPSPAEKGVTVVLCQDSLLLANKRCPRTIDIYLDASLAPKQVCARH
jgi:penicillin-binding protein 1A